MPENTTIEQLDQVRALIDAAPAAKHTLDSLAEAVGVSRFYFLRAFARRVGLPPHTYILFKRVELASVLIREGHGLAHTASECGFADQSHMTRAFRHRYGLPPRRWALAVRESAAA